MIEKCNKKKNDRSSKYREDELLPAGCPRAGVPISGNEVSVRSVEQRYEGGV